MSCGVIINSIGLIFDIIGAGIIFIYVPALWEVVGSRVQLAGKSNDKNKKLSKIGFSILIIGFALQLISNFVE